MTETVHSALIDEIERIAAKRERWRGYMAEMPGMSGVGMNLTINLMTVEIDNAKEALAFNDALACIRALEDLRGYDDDD